MSFFGGLPPPQKRVSKLTKQSWFPMKTTPRRSKEIPPRILGKPFRSWAFLAEADFTAFSQLRLPQLFEQSLARQGVTLFVCFFASVWLRVLFSFSPRVFQFFPSDFRGPPPPGANRPTREFREASARPRPSSAAPCRWRCRAGTWWAWRPRAAASAVPDVSFRRCVE